MAKQKLYVTEEGFICAESYWMLIQANFNLIERTALIVFYGYKDKNSTLRKSIGYKKYYLTEFDFDKYFSVIAMTGTNYVAQTYKMAMETLDTKNNNLTNNESPMVSFFNGAIDC